jgi:hypothetical protein
MSSFVLDQIQVPQTWQSTPEYIADSNQLNAAWLYNSSGSYATVDAKPSWVEADMFTKDSYEISGNIEKSLSSLVSQGVRMLNISEVRSYLLSYLDIIDALILAVNEAKKVLAPGDQIELSLYQDPEEPTSYLYLEIIKREYPAQFYQKIKQIRKTYRSLLTKTKGWLLVSTDFRSPI